MFDLVTRHKSLVFQVWKIDEDIFFLLLQSLIKGDIKKKKGGSIVPLCTSDATCLSDVSLAKKQTIRKKRIGKT